MTIRRLIRALDSLCARAETRWGLGVAAVLLALAAMAAACLSVVPSLAPRDHAIVYQQMSLDPLGLQEVTPLQRRMLTPLLAHAVLLRGDSYLFFPWLMGAAWLAVVYGASRRRGLTGSAALGLVFALAFSAPILEALRLPGYVDTTTNLLVTLCLVFPRPPHWGPLWALALLNHETALFAAPWLVWRGDRGPRREREVALNLATAILALVPMTLWRVLVGRSGGFHYSLIYYINGGTMEEAQALVAPTLPLGGFMAFRLLWLMPLVAATVSVRARMHSQAVWLGVVVLCAVAQLAFAYDTTRLLAFAFPALVVSGWLLAEKWGSEGAARLIWSLTLASALIPAASAANGAVHWVGWLVRDRP